MSEDFWAPPPPPVWELWAPPLDPPREGGLPRAVAEAIADSWFDCDPHLAAAMMWEAYAAMLPPGPQVTAVQTGVQSVTYAAPGPGGEALARAAWHRSMAGSLATVPLGLAEPELDGGWPEPAWWTVEADP